MLKSSDPSEFGDAVAGEGTTAADARLIGAKLEETRRGLLDLTRNNRLLNHKTKGQRTLRIVDESPVEVYRILVGEERAMQFLAREEAPVEIRDRLPSSDDGDAPPLASAPSPGTAPMGVLADLPLAPVATGGPGKDRYRDDNLQTLLTGERLQTRLVHLARESASALEEQGYNILYLTLGTVEWREAGGGEQAVVSRAPLVFVPVELTRKTVNTRYAIRPFDDDVVVNPSLIELCRSMFHVQWPVFDPEQDELAAYFEQVTAAVAPLAGWRFVPDVHVGLFSFSKLLMYRDLDPRNWPADRSLTAHPLIRQLTGLPIEPGSNPRNDDGGGGDALPDPATLDRDVTPEECFQVVDADSSQQAAILAAKRGLSLVIDGPPGTGKSQTITNVIAECLSEGRTVLFVSEKAAALEVVKRRLEQVGLGDFVLELHSRKASKRSVLQEIQRVLERQPAPVRVPEQTAADLLRVRDGLNAYRRELHEPFEAMGISPFEGMSRAIGLAGEPEATCDIAAVASWPPQQLAAAAQQLESLDRRLGRVGDAGAHPWRGVGLRNVGLREQQAIRGAADRLIQVLQEVRDAAGASALLLGRPAGPDVRDARKLLAAADVLLACPRVAGPIVLDERWDAQRDGLRAWLQGGRRRAELQRDWGAVLRPEAEADRQDWPALLDRRRRHGRSLVRLLRPSWYADSRALRAVSVGGTLPPLGAQISALEALVESRRLRASIEGQAAQFGDLFGPQWTGVDGDWPALERFSQAVAAVRQLVTAGYLDRSVVARVAESDDRGDLSAVTDRLRRAMPPLPDAWKAWFDAIASDETQWLKAECETAELPALIDRLTPLPGQIESLQDWVDVRNAVRECSAGPLQPFVAWALSAAGAPARGRLAGTFRRHFYRLWVDEAFGRRSSLKEFRGQDHEALVARFRELDRRWLELTRHRLHARLATRRPNVAHAAHRQSKLGIVQAEIRKKTRHMPLRKLLLAAGEVVQAAKPCFMMSPPSVAQYLAPGGTEFDVVVFDEASQVEPADAYGAVARGRQLLLVGDERQLPPTNFFARADPEEAATNAAGEADGDDGDFRVRDLESILSLGIVRLPHRHCRLRWHYRSRHASLIDFSNARFYDNQLRVFPSPHTDRSELGVCFRFVEGGVYLRGAGRYNPVEAQTVAREVVRHALEHPELSLGVGTLNLPQQQAIEDEVERLRRTESDPRVERFFERHEAEPFFVKNLENIQGDERDVILLSVGHGKDANGRLYANFGALNGDGGWRRLNVLVTRARRRCVVFSSVRADDINLGGTQARGVVALKEYLYAAEHGRLKDAAVPGGDHDSEFEAAVCRALRERGHEVHAQVGTAGFAIDLAVVDPRSPGRYLLGIECDGATYHSSPTARDRDRLRQAVLEDLGWRIHRIWSTDWFQRPGTVLQRLVERLEELAREPVAPDPQASVVQQVAPLETRTDAPSGQRSAEPEEGPAVTDAGGAAPLPPGVVPYAHRRGQKVLGSPEELLAERPASLAATIRDAVRDESPLHAEEALRVVAEMYGARASARPRQAFERAVEVAVARGWVDRRDEFLWDPRQRDLPVRHRGGDCPVTKPEHIAPEELDAAVMLVLRQQFGLQFDAVIESTARLFGFARTGTRLKAAVERTLVRLDQRGVIERDAAGFVTLPGSSKG